MIDFGVGTEGSYQKNLGMGFVIAIAVHIIFGFYIDDVLKVNSAIENKYSQKQFNVKLLKSKKIIRETLNEDFSNTDSYSKKIIVTKTPKPNPTLSIQPSKAWIETEIKTHLKENPVSMEIFKQSFVINQNNDSEPATYFRELHNGIIDVKKKLFGKDICYFFDASDNSSGAIIFHPCKEKSIFNFKMKRLK